MLIGPQAHNNTLRPKPLSMAELEMGNSDNSSTSFSYFFCLKVDFGLRPSADVPQSKLSRE